MNLGVTVTYCGIDHGSEVKVPACNAGDLGSIPGLPFPCPRGHKESDMTEQLHFHCGVEGFVWLLLFIFNVGTPLCNL